MAGEISSLTLATALNLTDRFEVTQDPTGTPATKAGTPGLLADALGFDSLLLHAGAFATRTGAPTHTASATAPALDYWAFDSATDESIVTLAEIPPWWATFNVRVVGCNLSASSGGVRLRADVRSFSGSVLHPMTLDAQVSSSITHAGTQYERGEAVLGSAVTRPSDGMVTVTIVRSTAHADDTLANDWALMWVSLERAS